MKLLIVVSFTDLIILDPENTFQMKSWRVTAKKTH